MEQELFNQLLANSPFFVIFMYYARKIGELGERIAQIEGIINEQHQRYHKK